MESEFLAGVIEGFYGAPWSRDQRFRLLDALETNGLNTYMYAPKDDLKHRALWRDAYGPEELSALGELCRGCGERDLHLIYGLAPGLDMAYGRREEMETLQDKLVPILDHGAGAVALLFDDIPEVLSPDDAKVYPSFAHAHVAVANELWEWLRQRWPGTRLLFCPTPYCEAMSGLVEDCAYLRHLGNSLQPEIDCFWTGPDIISERLPPGGIEDLTEVIGRPPIIWDNLHANDYDMRRLFLGPVAGRPPELLPKINGLLTNPNCEFEANHNVTVTLGKYVTQREAYDPESAYEAAIRAWLPAWETHGEPISEEELRFFCDSFYLPHQLGETAAAWLEGVVGSGEGQSAASDLAIGLARKVTVLKDRALMHALYRHAWELKESALLLKLAKERSSAFTSWEFRHPIMRNGVLAQVESLLPMDVAGAYHGHGHAPSSVAGGRVRLARATDEEALYQICLETGDEGDDGRHLYEDPKILGVIYAAPYLHLAPELAYVLEDEEGVCGYCLGVLDSESFYGRYEAEWLPPWRERYPPPPEPRSEWSLTQQIVQKLYEPETYMPPEASEFPSHLHIDLLARAQGHGQGTRMIFRLLHELARLGSRGVHLGVGLANRRAIRFYRKIGFRELARHGDCLYMGLPLRRSSLG